MRHVAESQPRFVDQRRWLQGVSRRFPGQLKRRETFQLPIDERHEYLLGTRISTANPFDEEREIRHELLEGNWTLRVSDPGGVGGRTEAKPRQPS